MINISWNSPKLSNNIDIDGLFELQIDILKVSNALDPSPGSYRIFYSISK